MTVAVEHDLVTQLADAVALARSSRHHPDCNCCIIRHRGAGYCSVVEWQRSEDINTLLETIRRRSF